MKKNTLTGIGLNFYYEGKDVVPKVIIVCISFIAIQTGILISAMKSLQYNSQPNYLLEDGSYVNPITISEAIDNSWILIVFMIFLSISLAMPYYIVVKDYHGTKRSHAIKTLPFPRWINYAAKLFFAPMMSIGIYLSQFISVILSYYLFPFFADGLSFTGYRSRDLYLSFVQNDFLRTFFPMNYGVLIWIEIIVLMSVVCLYVWLCSLKQNFDKNYFIRLGFSLLPILITFFAFMDTDTRSGTFVFGTYIMVDLLVVFVITVPLITLISLAYKRIKI